MLAWILLAPYAAATARSMSRPLLIAVLLPCALYTPYAMVGATLEGYLFWSTPAADHAVAEWIEEGTAPSTVVALSPDERPTYLTYWTRRPVVFHDSRLALLFGATVDQVDAVQAALRAAYAEARPRAAAEAFRQLGADLVIVDATTTQARAWAASSCFITGYRTEVWMAAAPEPGACPR